MFEAGQSLQAVPADGRLLETEVEELLGLNLNHLVCRGRE